MKRDGLGGVRGCVGGGGACVGVRRSASAMLGYSVNNVMFQYTLVHYSLNWEYDLNTLLEYITSTDIQALSDCQTLTLQDRKVMKN